MTHAQESRVSSTQDNFKLSEESRSSVSALVSRLNSSAFGVDGAENEKLRGDPTKAKEQKMQDPFPWMPGFFNLCQSTVGSRNVKHLENLMNIYLENVTPNVKDCYTKPNRAARLKKSMNATLIFFHLFYQEIKEAFEHSSYLDKMTRLVSMFMDMEIKASLRGKESFTKVSARLTSSLYIFLDNSEEHILDAILMTKYIHKNYRDICRSLLRKLLHNISTYPMNEMLYVRCLLTFKLWKKIVVDPEERKVINKTAMQKLHAPPNLMENIKAMGNFLPRIPKTKKNITLFLMQSNFNLKNTCQEFFKSVKKSQKTAYSQGLGSLEMDKPLFFINTSENTSPRLTEKGDESDSGCSNNLINDLWSSISTAESNVPQTKMLKELTKDKAVAVESVVVQKKKKKLGKKVKKGKKKKQVSSGTKIKKKKKSLLKHSEPTGTEKEGKKLSNLKGKKKKKKKLRLIDESNQVNIKQAAPQIDECNQVKAKQALSQIEEFHQMVVKPTSPHQIEECNQSQVKQALPQTDECDQVNVKMDLPQIEESNLLKVKQSLSQVEECKEGKMKQTSLQLEECDPGKVNPSSPQMEQCDQVKMKEAKVESQLDLPKTEKLDGLLSSTGQIQDAEVSSKVEEPFVKKVKIECISNMFGDSQFDIKKNMASETMEQGSTDSGISSEKSSITIAEYNKPIVSADEAITPSDDLATKSNCKDQVESVFDNSRSDLFTVEKGKDMLNEKEGENLGVEEGKVVDYCHKPKISENSGPVYVCTMGMCDVSLKQELSDDNREMETSEVNINVQIETDSEILDELKPQEMGKCDASASEEEIVIGNDNIFATGNGDLVMEILETQYPMSRGVLSGEFETENPPVSNELESEPSVNMAGFENNIVDYFTSKAIKDDNPSLYYTHSIDDLDWIYDSNNPMKNYEIERPILPSHWMEGEEEEVLESNSSKSFELPKRGMGKMSYREALMSYSRQKELRASSYGRHNSQTYLVTNSSESGSASVETSPLLTSSASGSSSPRSESAVEGVCQENMEACGNLTKSAELSVSSERIPDVSNLRYYNSSNYQKSPETVSCEKESFNSHSSYSFKVGDCRMDNARVVVETMDHSLVNRASSNRLTVDSSTPETSSHKNVGGTGVQQSPVRRKKSPGKLHPENTVDSQNASGKQGAGELSVAQNRASIRGRRKRGRPPSRGRGVSSISKLSSDTKSTREQGCNEKGKNDSGRRKRGRPPSRERCVSSASKLSSDTKSTRDQGCNGKGKNDPEYQFTQQYDYAFTRSKTKKLGISEVSNMFEHL